MTARATLKSHGLPEIWAVLMGLCEVSNDNF